MDHSSQDYKEQFVNDFEEEMWGECVGSEAKNVIWDLRTEFIDKASHWLQENMDFGTPAYRERFVKDFIEAMKEE